MQALEHVGRVVKPGGCIAILENDTMHQVFLPCPVGLEIPLRAAELRALSDETGNPSKFYIGRRLSAVFATAGFEPLQTHTIAIDRQAPFGTAERQLLQSYLDARPRLPEEGFLSEAGGPDARCGPS